MISINKSTFEKVNVLVIGDAMLDRYFFGKIDRQSPEADVPVVDIDTIENKLGGAANVALNIKKMNANVELICSIGEDETGTDFLKAIKGNEIIADRVIVSNKRQSTLKGRVYNDKEYLLRLDRETISDFTNEESYVLLQKIKASIDNFKPDVAILQDYNKGVLTKANIPEIIELLQNNDVKIAVDPKKDNFLAFKNVDLFKPNLKEISEALHLEIDASNEANLKQTCLQLQEEIKCKNCLVTLSEYGVVCLDEAQNFKHFAAFKRNVLDVSGAGDTVISVAALFLALDTEIEDIAFYSNLAGGMTIEKKGVNALTIEEFVDELKVQGIN
ncbi:MAG: bifunctional heptose 7-phosphate kinase/heptose 1-phosphate adenyltransferase [Chitinophagales bacterium]